MAIDLPPPNLPIPGPILAAEQASNYITSAFLTYAHADPRFVDEVNLALREVGVRTYLDREFLEIGRMDDQIIASIKQVEFQIIFCTRASNNSDWCRKEVDFSRTQGVKQIPIIIDPIASMDWFHFHLSKQYAVVIDEIQEKEAALLATTRMLKKLMKIDFGGYSERK